MKDTVTITVEEYEELKSARDFLRAQEELGISSQKTFEPVLEGVSLPWFLQGERNDQ